MERNPGKTEDSRINEAQILARLRRRPSSAPRPTDDALDSIAEFASDAALSAAASRREVRANATLGETDEINESGKTDESEKVGELGRFGESNGIDGARKIGGTDKIADKIAESEGRGSDDVGEDRAATLRRLVAGGAPKEPMSALSPALRNLREELGADAASYSAVFDADSVPSADATLDLIESELASAGALRETAAPSEPPRPTSESDSASKAANRAAPSLNFRHLAAAAPRVDLIAPRPDAASEKRVAVADLMVVSQLKKGYVKAKKLIPVLQGVDLTARQGELLAIVGQSGSGKSTLLHLMGTLDVPDSGTIYFDGQRIDNLPTSQRDVLRNYFIGMIFQFYHLIPEMTTLENVLAPLMIRDSILKYWRNRSKYVAQAKEILEMVGLSHRLRHRPNELSGGEMQRASIARALVARPRILLADEPTGNLDSKASVGILKLLRKLNEEQNLTVVMVTHDMSQAAEADRAIRLVDGLVVPE